jgi:integrase
MNIYSVKGKKKPKTDKSLNSKKLKTEIKERKRHSNDPLTREEIETLLNGTDNITDHTLFFIGFYTGMRVSEIVSMEDISLNENEGRIHIWDEKKNLYRDIYVPSELFSVARRYINTLKDRKDPRIFPISTKTAERKIEYWTSKVLGKTKSWHAVRHTYISLSRELELPMEIVIANTGDTPATILKYYSKPSPQFIRKVIEERKLFEVKS